jgi:hypothetical protein
LLPARRAAFAAASRRLFISIWPGLNPFQPIPPLSDEWVARSFSLTRKRLRHRPTRQPASADGPERTIRHPVEELEFDFRFTPELHWSATITAAPPE